MAGRLAGLSWLMLALAAAPACLAHDTESFFRLDLPQGQIQGTELIPHIDEPMPCVVLLGGALSADRDGRLLDAKAPPRDALRRLAEALQAGGYGSVRYDRVGYGRSKPRKDWTGSYDDEAAVAAALIEAVRERREFTKVIVLAESEAAYVACLAAKDGMQADGYILLGALCGPAERPPLRSEPFAQSPDKVLKHLTAPVLALAGSADRSVPPEHAAKIAALLKESGNKDATSRLIEGADQNLQRAAESEEKLHRPYEARAYHAMLEWLYARFPTPAEGKPEQIEQIAARATPQIAAPGRANGAIDKQP